MRNEVVVREGIEARARASDYESRSAPVVWKAVVRVKRRDLCMIKDAVFLIIDECTSHRIQNIVSKESHLHTVA